MAIVSHWNDGRGLFQFAGQKRNEILCCRACPVPSIYASLYDIMLIARSPWRLRQMNYPLRSWDEDHDKPVRITCYLITALSIAFCVALFVYVILM
jgi:hypothetical protein